MKITFLLLAFLIALASQQPSPYTLIPNQIEPASTQKSLELEKTDKAESQNLRTEEATPAEKSEEKKEDSTGQHEMKSESQKKHQDRQSPEEKKKRRDGQRQQASSEDISQDKDEHGRGKRN